MSPSTSARLSDAGNGFAFVMCRELPTTLEPRFKNASTSPAPIPCEAPVTIAVFCVFAISKLLLGARFEYPEVNERIVLLAKSKSSERRGTVRCRSSCARKFLPFCRADTLDLRAISRRVEKRPLLRRRWRSLPQRRRPSHLMLGIQPASRSRAAPRAFCWDCKCEGHL